MQLETNANQRNSLSMLDSPARIKIVAIGVLTFMFLMVTTMLESLIGAREQGRRQVAAVIALVPADARSIRKRTELAIIVGGLLAIVYGCSHWLRELVDYALVAGSIGLFVVLSAIAFPTRNIDCYPIKVASGSVTRHAGTPTEPTR
jgi:inner membrane protein involved in colicin E2 resistance